MAKREPAEKPKQLIELPKSMELIECPKDGLVLLDKRWVPLEPLQLARKLAKVNGEVDSWEVMPSGRSMDVEVSGWLGPGEQRRERHRLEITLRKQLCDVHSSMSNGYWEATLQLRGNWDGEYFHFAERRLAEISKRDRWAFHRDKTVKGGVDIFCGSKQAVWKVAQEMKAQFRADIIKSTTVVGRKNNKNLKRLTVSVRFP